MYINDSFENRFLATKIAVRTFLPILFILSVAGCSRAKKVKTITVETNYNVEALVIAFEIAENGFWNFPFDDFQPMKSLVRREFKKYREHETVKLIDTLVAKGFWLDAMTEVMLKSSPLPNARLIEDMNHSTLLRLSDDLEESHKMVANFINAMHQFYIDAGLDAYFMGNLPYYDTINEEVRKNIPNASFIATMEEYYGKQNEAYTLVPSPALYHTMGFGKNIKGDTGFKVYNVFGPLIVTKDSLEFGNGFDDLNKINELTVHEFGHSFINPILDKEVYKEHIDSFAHLFERIRKPMKEQGYGSWRSCLAEHVVRLGEIRISYAMGDSDRAERLREEYVHERKFIYIPLMEKGIKAYEDNRDIYKTIDDYIPKLLTCLETTEKQ
ncbi:MAG: DUF4932 domain-containing protein, partial [Muricauda sp. TMED12]